MCTPQLHNFSFAAQPRRGDLAIACDAAFLPGSFKSNLSRQETRRNRGTGRSWGANNAFARRFYRHVAPKELARIERNYTLRRSDDFFAQCRGLEHFHFRAEAQYPFNRHFFHIEPQCDSYPSVWVRRLRLADARESSCEAQSREDVLVSSDDCDIPGKLSLEVNGRSLPIGREIEVLRTNARIVCQFCGDYSRYAIAANFALDVSYEIPRTAFGYQAERIGETVD